MALSAARFWRRPQAPRATPGERVVYAVGDVHGRADLLSALLRRIGEDAAGLGLEVPPILVFLGDYVDRGDHSRSVVDQVIAARNEGRFEVRTLKGNHEAALLAFLEDASFGPTWADYGGIQTLQSYGVAPPLRRSDREGWEKAREDFAARLPPSHLDFFGNLELAITLGDYVFVHAGVRPGTPLEAQREHDLLWIRDEFLRFEGPFERVVVHGHTPEIDPFIGDHRIGIDTGAYATGVLTAVRLMGERRDIIQAGREDAKTSAFGAGSHGS